MLLGMEREKNNDGLQEFRIFETLLWLQPPSSSPSRYTMSIHVLKAQGREHCLPLFRYENIPDEALEAAGHLEYTQPHF